MFSYGLNYVINLCYYFDICEKSEVNMKRRLIKLSTYLLVLSLFLSGCNQSENEVTTVDNSIEIIEYEEALSILKESVEAEILDIETGITYIVRRVTGGFNTIADIETVSLEDTEKLLESVGGRWNIKRRAVIVTVGEFKIAASIAPFEHSGDESKPFGEIIDNRSGSTGTGVNLDSIRENGMIGVVDLYFYNSLTPGVNRVDERHQEMVMKAYEYQK